MKHLYDLLETITDLKNKSQIAFTDAAKEDLDKDIQSLFWFPINLAENELESIEKDSDDLDETHCEFIDALGDMEETANELIDDTNGYLESGCDELDLIGVKIGLFSVISGLQKLHVSLQEQLNG